MKTSNKSLIALLIGLLLAILGNNLFVKAQYEKMIESHPIGKAKVAH